MAAGYSIPVSVSNAQNPASGVSGGTEIEFGNGYIQADPDNTVVPTATATSAAASGNAAASQGSSGTNLPAGSGVTAGALNSTGTFNYPLVLGVSAGVLILIAAAFFVGEKIK